ncbi:sensor histidine kinase [Frigoribacterium sp. 2-23]|uniref:sensor histidine kinase n=1 Tax=Frigoribacterium sp. 2-23 TaxID=3415006 RepID=UPI003C6FC2E2
MTASGRWSRVRGAVGLGTPMTLRRQLVLSIVALVVIVTVVIGAVSVVALRGFLLRQLDDELDQASGRAVVIAQEILSGSAGAGSAFGSGPDQGFVNGPGQGAGTFAAVVHGNTVQAAGRVNEQGEVETPLDQAGANRLVAASVVAKRGEPMTIDLGGTLGSYRVQFVVLGTTSSSASSAVTTTSVVVGLPMASVTSTVTQQITLIALVTLLGLAVAIAVSFLVVGLALRPLRRMSDTALRVAELPLDRGEVALAERVDDQDTDTRTEVGRVGASLNKMLGHVAGALEARQQSENKVRQFVADASHELRTPLASVRGYAELTRRMNTGLPDDVVYAMGRIESESLRMTSLVEDLLLLARLDEGRDLVSADVDLTRVLLDAVNDAHVAGPAYAVDIDVPDEPVVVPGDAMRLHQIVANLLTNARTHTPEGTAIHVALGVDAARGQAVVTVADDGPGIEPSVLPVLFERFARADSSRSRKAGSTGLGLAIVEAVVHAHQGSVTVDSSAAGATFTIRLPLRAAAVAGAPPAVAPAPGAPA